MAPLVVTVPVMMVAPVVVVMVLTMTTEGRILRSGGDVAEGQRIITVLADGTLSSSVDIVPAKDIGPAKDAAVTKDAGDVSTKIEEATS